MSVWCFALVLLWCPTVLLAADLPRTIATQTRRCFNFSSLLGNPKQCAKTPYDRVVGHPVFQVTTAWGSSYMNMEKLTSSEDSIAPSQDMIASKNPKQLKSLNQDTNEYRTISLYFMDPDDALASHAELKQLEQLKNSDIRITATSLGKALRSASNLGRGLVTGYPIEPLTGNLKSVDEGGSLRHKILPPKRQLFYAARCIGKERVGLFSDNPVEDAVAAVMGNSALQDLNIIRRREKQERKGAPKAKATPMQARNAHMEGHVGIPVFWAQGMQRQLPMVKRVLTGNRQETPLFFNYEDLIDAWAKMKEHNPNIPDKPTVEVFNLWDVLTSMDRETWKKSTKQKYDWGKPLRQRFGKNEDPDLDAITFVPSSRAIEYKEAISARGNSKARLRPMR